MKALARALSILLHPLWMPLYTFLVAFRVEPHLGFFMPKEAQWYNHLVVAVMTGVFPLLGALILRRGHRMDDVVLNDRAARISPMMGTLIYYCVAYWLLRKYPHQPAALSMFLGMGLTLVATLVTTFWWKVSLHMAGIGGLIGALLALQQLFGSFSVLLIVPFVLVARLLGTARLVDSDHTPAQLYVGTLMGFACVYVAMMAGVVL
ncbi:MAG: hypothetical protein IPJ76_08280 [Flavobacteriales bacterium]|nr:MAG: hypothetical protein IPJ76_08280 [Flavobacteriales bacterium]